MSPSSSQPVPPVPAVVPPGGPPPASLSGRAAGPPPEPGAEPTGAQWPSQCEPLTGITYRYQKGITSAWQRQRLARVAKLPPKPATEA